MGKEQLLASGLLSQMRGVDLLIQWTDLLKKRIINPQQRNEGNKQRVINTDMPTFQQKSLFLFNFFTLLTEMRIFVAIIHYNADIVYL